MTKSKTLDTTDKAAGASATLAMSFEALASQTEQFIRQFKEKRALLLSDRQRIAALLRTELSRPLGPDVMKLLAFARIDGAANFYRRHATMKASLSTLMHPGGDRPDLESYRGNGNFEQSTRAGHPLCLADAIQIDLADTEDLPRQVQLLCAAEGEQFFWPHRLPKAPAADASLQERHNAAAAAAEAIKLQHGMLCLLLGDVMKQRISDFIDQRVEEGLSSAGINAARARADELAAQLVNLDQELLDLDKGIAELPIACPERAEARMRLNLPPDLTNVPAGFLAG